MSDDEKLMKDHEYDGIQELDNDLPPWWVNLFYATIIFAVAYLAYYHVFSMGPLQEEAYQEEMKAWESKGTSNQSGKSLYAIHCLSCHGKSGEGNASIRAPQIAGQEDWYLHKQITHFKEGIRGSDKQDVPGNTMRTISISAIVDDEVKNAIVDYVASLSIQKQALTIEGNLENGKTKYISCSGCHMPNAQGNADLKAPRLTGLNDWYIVAQLQNFKKGLRGTNPKDTHGMMMRPLTLGLSDQDMKDIAVYIQSLNK